MSRDITTTTFYALPLQPIKRAVSRAFIRWQLRSLDRSLDVLSNQIKNDMKAQAELTKERAMLARRLL